MQCMSRRGSGDRRMKALRYFLAVYFIVAMSWLRSGLPVLAQVPVVEPDDVATPTPMPPVSLLPTPTPDGMSAGEVHSAEADICVVKEEDTLWSVSLEIGVDLQEMPCVVRPDFQMDQPLVIGDALVPPPSGMICHRVEGGETLASIAAQYGVDPAVIYGDAWNQLAMQPRGDGHLDAGRYVRILPQADSGESGQGGFLGHMLAQPVEVTPYMAYAVGGAQSAPAPAAVPADWPYGSGNFLWPTYGWVSQGYRLDHRAVDIAAPMGAFVTAADRGVVVRAGWNDQGYGLFVVIDHNIDYVTLYSHLQEIYVQEGDIVAQGQVIGAVGSTGNSTGPHLHFEVRDFGARINPLEVLLR